MMTGRLYIDGNDAYRQYGVYVVDDGWNDLVAMPPLKSVETNDWQEEDGIEADLSSPVLNTREVSVKIAISGLFSRYMALIELLSDGAYHTFDCAEIQRKYKLRLTSTGNLDAAARLGSATLKFSDDFPLESYTYKPPETTVGRYDDYAFDDIPFTSYGVRVLQGSLSEVKKTAAVKPNLLRNINTMPGAIYDASVVTFKSKDVKLTCLIRAATLSELWRNYDAMLFDLIRPGERMLWVDALEQSFPFYYKSCSVSEFNPEGKIWLKFTLTLTFTGNFRINDDDFVLAAENSIIVFTEDGVNAIEMLPERFNYPSVRLVNDRYTMRLLGNGYIRLNN